MDRFLYRTCCVFIAVWTILWSFDLVPKLFELLTHASEFSYESGVTPSLDNWDKIAEQYGRMIGFAFWCGVWFFPSVGVGVFGLLMKPTDYQEPVKPRQRQNYDMPISLKAMVSDSDTI